MVECQLPKLDVAGSSPVSRSIFSRTYKNHKNRAYCDYCVKPSCLLTHRYFQGPYGR